MLGKGSHLKLPQEVLKMDSAEWTEGILGAKGHRNKRRLRQRDGELALLRMGSWFWSHT